MRRTTRTLFTLLVSLWLLLLLQTVSAAQDFRATITGRITDANKAAIPSAQVTVKNTGTNETTTATTDSAGNYKAPLLRPGTYSVAVEATGFKKAIHENIELVINQVATIDISLEPGSISEQVTVQGEAPLLESATADRGSVIDRQRVLELPLNARNPFMLGIHTPGVNFNGASIWQRPFDNGAIAEWTINGSQSRGNEFLLDGAPNNSQAGGNNIAYVPPVDSVQDFKIMTNTYDAQYGKTTGGIVNVNLRSGTNAFHGSVYEFMRREWLDATDFRVKANNQPKPKHYLDQYGFQVEGPVWIPKFYDGRDKTFFMFNYEGYREGINAPLTLSVPEPEMLQGDFSKLVDRAGNPIIIYDPLTTCGRFNNPACAVDSQGREIITRQPFAGNRIPAGRLNPIAQRILSYYPKPNRRDPTSGYSFNNLYISPNLATDSFFNYVLKVDQQFNERHRMYVRYAKNDRTEDRNTNGITNGPGQDGQHPLKRINDAFVVDHLAAFSPTFIFNIRASLARYVEGSRGDANIGFDKTTLGFPPELISQIPSDPTFGRYEFSGYASLGRQSNFNYTNTAALHPTFTWIRGSRTWRGGVDMRWTQYAVQDQQNPFRLTAGTEFTRNRFDQADPLQGNPIASFLLGYVNGGGVDYPLFYITLGKYYAPWVQNDWKVNRRLTLNTGVRWDINVPPNERYDRLNRGFDPNVINPVDSLIDRAKFPNFPQLKGGINFAGVGDLPRTAANTDWNNIQPRLGFAYLLKENLVMRGGWGLYYVNPSNDYLQFNGYRVATPIVGSLDGNRTPVIDLLNNPFPNGVTIPAGASGGLLTFLGRDNTGNTFNIVNTTFNVPYVHQFSFGFQYQLPWEAKVELTYVGNRTRGLETNRPFNEPDLALRQKCNPAEGGNPAFCNELLPNPFQGLEPFRGTRYFDSPRLSRWDLSRPYPHYGRITERSRNDGAINYDSLQVMFEKRAKGGLNLVATYTFSKQIETWGWNDVQKGVKQRGLYLWDRPHRFTTGMVYQLPFGEGKKLFNTSNRFLKKIIGGWETNLIFQWESGRPWDLPYDNGNDQANNIMWINPDAIVKDIKWKGTDQVWALRTYQNRDNPSIRSACAGRINDAGQVELLSYSAQLVGCTPQNVDVIRRGQFAPRYMSYRHPSIRLHSPPIADLSFNKMTKLSERMGLQFRVEMFNFTNTFSYRSVQFQSNPENSNFGSIIPRNGANDQVAYPRHIQLAMKFTW
jgi:Carboxypeptidase regulatory-like domain/TonB-dependent Receptor Plug Domain